MTPELNDLLVYLSRLFGASLPENKHEDFSKAVSRYVDTLPADKLVPPLTSEEIALLRDSFRAPLANSSGAPLDGQS